jgi:hypothetical protein
MPGLGSEAVDFRAAWIQAGRFYGVDKSRIVDRTEIHGHLVRAVEDAIAFSREVDTSPGLCHVVGGWSVVGLLDHRIVRLLKRMKFL